MIGRPQPLREDEFRQIAPIVFQQAHMDWGAWEPAASSSAGSQASVPDRGAKACYLPSEHRAIAEAGNIRVPRDDYDGYIENHIRRLDALRRAGIVERVNADHWSTPTDFEARAAAYDQASEPARSLGL
jgi:hypothetical protein